MIKNFNRDNLGYRQVASLAELMTAAPMSAEMHAALQRKKTETRRAIEDRRMAAQFMEETYGKLA